MTTLALARTPERGALVRAVCVREWREALGNRLLVAMTLLPPIVILAAGRDRRGYLLRTCIAWKTFG